MQEGGQYLQHDMTQCREPSRLVIVSFVPPENYHSIDDAHVDESEGARFRERGDDRPHDLAFRGK